MNSHLNIFNSYSKKNRQFQLENDLTRALAICMQENSLFLNDLLKDVFLGTNFFDEFFNDLETNNEITICIQNNSKLISAFDKLFAVSLSEQVMNVHDFWSQQNKTLYNPICDIVIRINQIVIIIEAKRDNVNCTAQLYKQAFNICKKNNIPPDKMRDIVHPVDMNWPKLMEKAVKVHSFETATGTQNRFLKDFIDLVKKHNYRWLPEPSILSLSADNTKAITRRIESAINELSKSDKYKKLPYKDRLGFYFDKPWAKEVLFNVSGKGDLVIAIYPGNTKTQGEYIFTHDPQINEVFTFNNNVYNVSTSYNIRFASFQSYFTGLWFNDEKQLKPIYTKDNFWKYCGRKKRGKDWEEIENFFDKCFIREYDWRKKCSWEKKVINSGRNQFDLSFGYELCIHFPFNELREIDQNKSDLSGLTNLIECAVDFFKSIYKK